MCFFQTYIVPNVDQFFPISWIWGTTFVTHRRILKDPKANGGVSGTADLGITKLVHAKHQAKHSDQVFMYNIIIYIYIWAIQSNGISTVDITVHLQ